MKLFKNPLLRIAGVILILYLGLFQNTYEKDSLGNRLSKEQIKKNLAEAKDKSVNIMSNIKMAKEYQKNLSEISNNKPIDPSDFIVKDVVIGKGEEAACGDFASIEYKSFANNNPLEKSKKYDLIIGKDSLIPAIQNNIIGMKKGGTRLIILTNNKNALNFEVTLLELKKTPNPAKCNFSNHE
jgi:FKBP-type peptidyl-prolyl cis-trans isomerase